MKNIILLGLALIAFACSSKFTIVKKDYDVTRINKVQNEDSFATALIAPYYNSIQGKMNEIIGYSRVVLKKEQPESSMGNFVCDAIMNHYQSQKPDLCVVNYGGLRIPQIADGAISTGKIFELMPFDNGMTMIYLPGKTLKQLFDKIAQKKGWPVSEGVSLQIQDGKLISSYLKGKEIDDAKTYRLLVSDYLANGGDECSFLKPMPHIDLKELFRDVLIAEIKTMNTKGEKISSSIDGRITEIK
jgi:2',3'-cyclic-nucleotide 2'-phosphodiesterase (5'-nucleotidase family)